MLKFLRGRKRSRNALLLFFVGVLTLSLVGLFSVVVSGGGAGLFGGAAGDDRAVAKVSDYKITMRDLKDSLASFGQQISQGQGRMNRPDIRTVYAQFGPQVLDGLISDKLVLYEADRLNLGATNEEVQARIKQLFNPWPGAEQYRARLQQAGLTPIRFEDSLRASIAREHLRSYITAAVQVSPQEVEEDYRRTNTKYTFRWVEVKPDPFRDKVQVTDADLQAYFNEHKDDFKITTEQRRARYIFIDKTKAGEAVQISDEELRQDFDPERNVQQVRVSQIVLVVPKAETESAAPANANANANTNAGKSAPAKRPLTEEEVRNKAQEIANRAKGGEDKQAEDFAKLAREMSEDAKSKANGGDIGWIKKDDKRETDDPLNTAFTLRQGEVSQPIRQGDKYYVLKVTDRKVATFEEAKPQLLKAARERKSYTEAVGIAKEAQDKFKESNNADAVVAEINQKHGAQVAAVKETPFFAQGDALPELGEAPEVGSAVFRLENVNDIADYVSTDKGFVVAQYIENRGPHDPGFDEVRSKVEQRYRADKAKELAADRARQIAAAKTPDEMKKIADSLGVKTDERAGLGATDSVGVLVGETSRAPLYKLNPGEVTREPIKTESGDSYVVATLVSRKDADMGEAFQKEKKSIEQRLLDEKRNTYFSTYLTMTQKQMKSDGKIKIYDDVIASAMEPSAGDEPGGQQMPFPGAPAAPSRTGPRRSPQGASQGTLP
ncbi:MAG TPA: SurA N-terminal domain-containing protein [Blastocatellia bacterium]|jgi:peptidyl-prolyl cis-trans isomerase D|nr:SurA N-terminal domain-containing protein [Blastocatellia bacterium]